MRARRSDAYLRPGLKKRHVFRIIAESGGMIRLPLTAVVTLCTHIIFFFSTEIPLNAPFLHCIFTVMTFIPVKYLLKKKKKMMFNSTTGSNETFHIIRQMYSKNTVFVQRK